MKIGVVTYPIQNNIENRPLNQFLDIIKPFSTEVNVITGLNNYESSENKIKVYGIKHKTGSSFFTNIYANIYMQFILFLKILEIYRNSDIWIYYCRGDMPLPMIFTKILNRKNVLVLASSPIEGFHTKKNRLISFIGYLQAKISFLLSDNIIVYSNCLVNQWKIEKMDGKISIGRKHFINFKKFRIKTKYENRSNLIGYVGRLEEGKGIGNFVNAIPKIISNLDDFNFIIAGDGPYRPYIEHFIKRNSLQDSVKILGWVPYEKLPDLINNLKMLVIPSYSESGPMIALESMACGTPVLSTKVGFIPDIVRNAETGFLLESNNPTDIARGIIDNLNNANMQLIINNAYNESKKFKYEENVEYYKKILELIK